MTRPARATRDARRKRKRAARSPLSGIFGNRMFVFGLVALGVLALLGGVTVFGALHMEESDAFCASCHTEPESDFVARAEASRGPTDLASFHTTRRTRCIECHSGGGPFGRLEGIMQGTQDLLAYWSGSYHAPAITTNPFSDDHCLKCHDNLTARQDFDNHFHLFLARWQLIDPAKAARCIACHTGHTANGDAQIQFLNQATVEPVCEACHSTLGEER